MGSMRLALALALCLFAAPAAAQTEEPESLPLLGDGPVAPEAARNFVWTHPYEFTFRPARWELEANDGHGGVRLRWAGTSASLTIRLDDVPVAKDEQPRKTLVGGVAAVETVGWQDAGDGRPATLYDVVRCKFRNKSVVLVLAIPEKHEAVADDAFKEIRLIQQSWRWH
jgi:hypothetical protein